MRVAQYLFGDLIPNGGLTRPYFGTLRDTAGVPLTFSRARVHGEARAVALNTFEGGGLYTSPIVWRGFEKNGLLSWWATQGRKFS
jgi:hypothetical protein